MAKQRIFWRLWFNARGLASEVALHPGFTYSMRGPIYLGSGMSFPVDFYPEKSSLPISRVEVSIW